MGDSRVVVHDGDGTAPDASDGGYNEREGVQVLNSDALVILSDGGMAALAREWGNTVDCWRTSAPALGQETGCAAARRAVVLLVECTAAQEADALATRAGATVRETHSVWCQSRQFTLVVADAVASASTARSGCIVSSSHVPM